MLPQSGTNPIMSMLPMLLIWFFIFYVLVFRPQSQARKAKQQMISNLKKHDEIVTTGGMYGIVVNVEPETVTVRVDDTVRIKLEKAAIERLVKSKGGDAELVTSEKRA